MGCCLCGEYSWGSAGVTRVAGRRGYVDEWRLGGAGVVLVLGGRGAGSAEGWMVGIVREGMCWEDMCGLRGSTVRALVGRACK